MLWAGANVATHSNKAVAVGAISFYLDHFVTGRISKFTYGAPCSASYQPFDPEHIRREHKAWLDPVGDKWVPDHFETMLLRVCHPPPPLSILLNEFVVLQGTKVLEDREVRRVFCNTTEGVLDKQAFQSVVKYTGANNNPQWMDIEQGSVSGFSDLVSGTKVKQKSSRRCAVYKQISLLLRIK